MWTFHGNSTPTLDDKGRVTVPARWRFDGLDELLAIPDGANPCVRLMPKEAFDDLLQKVQASTSHTEQDKLGIVRMYSASAFPCSIDKQGRVVLPAGYIESHQFSGEVTLVGAWRHIEVWRPADWKTYQERYSSMIGAGAQFFGL